MKGLTSIALASLLCSLSFGQQPQMQGWGIGSNYNALYNSQAESTISGRVVGITQIAPKAGMSPATRITVKEANGQIAAVDLGPEWYINHQVLRPHLNERVSITGSAAVVGGKPIIVARKVASGNHVMYLRDLTGSPLWVAIRKHIVVLNFAPNQNGARPGEANSGTGPVAIAQPTPSPTASQAKATPNADGVVQGTLQRRVTVQNPQTGQLEDYLIVSTPQGQISIDIGPDWYQRQQAYNWSPGGNIALSGLTPSSPVTTLSLGNGAPPIYFANGVGYGNQYMVLSNGPIHVWNAGF